MKLYSPLMTITLVSVTQLLAKQWSLGSETSLCP